MSAGVTKVLYNTGVTQAGCRDNWLTKILLLVTLLLLLLENKVDGYEASKCFCFKDAEFQAIKTAWMSKFTPIPKPRNYYYTGCYSQTENYFEACECSDVTTVRAKLVVTESSIIDQAKNASLHDDLVAEANIKVNELMVKFKNTTSIAGFEDRVQQILIPRLTDSTTNAVFDMDFIFIGQDISFEDKAKTAFNDVTPGSKLPESWTLDTADTTMLWKILSCTTNPIGTPTHGTRTWNNLKYTGAVATYGCDESYSFDSSVTTSLCDPNTLTWTTIDSPVCLEACTGDLPRPPLFAKSDWDRVTRTKGTKITYNCIEHYKSNDESNATMMCAGKNWTEVPSSFKCIEILCKQSQMPVLPARAITNWNGLQIDGTVIEYTCLEGYKSNTGVTPSIKCVNEKWEVLPRTWGCIADNVRLQSEEDAERKAQREKDLLELDAEELAAKNKLAEDLNLFVGVTLPSLGGMVLAVMFCLCCTRTDCLFCLICTRCRKKDSPFSKA